MQQGWIYEFEHFYTFSVLVNDVLRTAQFHRRDVEVFEIEGDKRAELRRKGAVPVQCFSNSAIGPHEITRSPGVSILLGNALADQICAIGGIQPPAAGIGFA
jgi:hypothetical protein